ELQNIQQGISNFQVIISSFGIPCSAVRYSFKQRCQYTLLPLPTIYFHTSLKKSVIISWIAFLPVDVSRAIFLIIIFLSTVASFIRVIDGFGKPASFHFFMR